MLLLSNSLSGIIILSLWCISGAIFFISPGSVRFQKPQGGFIVWLYNLVHLIYELFLIPLTGFLLLMERPELFKTTQFLNSCQSPAILKLVGLLLLFNGVALFCWARVVLRQSFRLACVKPSTNNFLIIEGPYRFVRNPMYTSVLLNCIGLTLIVQSCVFALLFIFFLIALVFSIIPTEEKHLETAYGSQYSAYMNKISRLMPLIY